MPKYSLTKVESAAGAAVVVGDYLLMSGDPIKMAIGYAVMAGISAYFGKHFIFIRFSFPRLLCEFFD